MDDMELRMIELRSEHGIEMAENRRREMERLAEAMCIRTPRKTMTFSTPHSADEAWEFCRHVERKHLIYRAVIDLIMWRKR